MIDVAVIGAGMAGLTCAQQLHQRGCKVVVVEKSRGLGGRLATRRMANIHADHGVRCLEVQGDLTQYLIQTLNAQGILRQWTDTLYEIDRSGHLAPSAEVHPRYASSDGLTSVAKFLSKDLTIWRNQRVTAIAATVDRTWTLSLEPLSPEPSQADLTLAAKILVVAVPAPQAVVLLEPLTAQGLPPQVLAALQAVRFDPCITAIASYPAAASPMGTQVSWQAIVCPDDPDLAWIAIDSTKQPHPQQTAVIIQSTAAFAQTYLESDDLRSVGQQMVARTAQMLFWQAIPEDLQVHRWRYAVASQPYPQPLLHTQSPLPLVCGGDWCGGANLESALRSGMHCAAQGMNYLEEMNHLTGTAMTDTNSSFATMLAQIV